MGWLLVLLVLLVGSKQVTFHQEIRTYRTFRDGDPRKSDVLITGLDAEGCERSFEFYSHAPGPSPEHGSACSELLYTPGPGPYDGTCFFYCEITGPL